MPVKRQLDHWLKAFVSYASVGEAPLYLYNWVGISTIAGALRRRVWIEQGIFQWLSNFYIILVAPPGIVSKTTSANIGMKLLRALNGEPYKRNIRFGPEIVTWQAILPRLEDSAELVSIPGFKPQIQSAITIVSDELGNLINPRNTELLDLLVSLWDGKFAGGGVIEKVTKGSGSNSVINPWVNLIGCTTPSWIAGNFPEYAIGGGLAARTVYVYADRKRQYVAWPGECLPPDFYEKQASLIHDLDIISQIAGRYELTQDALAWGAQWYEEHQQKRPVNLDNERFSVYLSRKQTHMCKTAMIVAAAKRNERVITLLDLQEAYTIITSLEEMMPRVFSQIGRSEETRHSDELVQYVKAKGEVEFMDLFRELFRIYSDDRTLEKAIASCQAAGFITTERLPGNKMMIRSVK